MEKMIRIGVDGTVSELENTGLESIYAAIGNGCTIIDCFRLQDEKRHVLYIDDEGMMKPNIMNQAAAALASLCQIKAKRFTLSYKEIDGFADWLKSLVDTLCKSRQNDSPGEV